MCVCVSLCICQAVSFPLSPLSPANLKTKTNKWRKNGKSWRHFYCYCNICILSLSLSPSFSVFCLPCCCIWEFQSLPWCVVAVICIGKNKCEKSGERERKTEKAVDSFPSCPSCAPLDGWMDGLWGGLNDREKSWTFWTATFLFSQPFIFYILQFKMNSILQLGCCFFGCPLYRISKMLSLLTSISHYFWTHFLLYIFSCQKVMKFWPF